VVGAGFVGATTAQRIVEKDLADVVGKFNKEVHAAHGAWLAGLDLALPRDNNPVVALGTECLAPIAGPWRLAGRAGFNSRTSGDVDGVTGLSFGFGLGYQKMTVDYALAPMGNLGLTQRISLSIAL